MKGPVLILLVLLIAVAAAFLVQDGGDAPSDDGGEPDDGPGIRVIGDLPDGISFDPASGSFTSASVTVWHVFDNLHAHMVNRSTVYTGATSSSDTWVPGTGSYTVTVGGGTFDVIVPGEITRVVEPWDYDMDGVVHRVSVTYSIPLDDYLAATGASALFNDKSNREYRFELLPQLVVVDGTIAELESALESEFVRIGGSVSDRQAYADFLAAFVQLTIEYPPMVDGGSYDTLVWGKDEYWCVPLETLYHRIGDCDDTAALLCSLYKAAGYDVAMGGHAGHVFAGVALDDFTECTPERLKKLNIGYYGLATRNVQVADGRSLDFYAVETIRDQNPVGYLSGGDSHLDRETWWGKAGFYPA